MTEIPAEKTARGELRLKNARHLAADRRAARTRLLRSRSCDFRHVGTPGWLGRADGGKAESLLVHLAFTVPLQFTASLFGFWRATAWPRPEWACLRRHLGRSRPRSPLPASLGSTERRVGLFLLVAGPAMWAPASAAFVERVAALVLATAGLRFVFTGLYQLTANEAWRRRWRDRLVLAAIAIYAAYAASSKTFSSDRSSPRPPRQGRTGGQRAPTPNRSRASRMSQVCVEQL